MSRPLVMVMEDLDAAALAWLRERCEVVECGPGAGDADALLARAEGLVVRTYTRVDAALLSRSPRLRVVGRAGVGLDTIDTAACRARGVEVVHTPDANSQAVAEYVVGLLLDVLRPRERVRAALSLDEWTRARRGQVGRQLGDLTVGVVGMGRVGRRVARAARGLGASVVYHDIVDVPEGAREGAAPVTLGALLAAGDVVSVHVDVRPGNRGLVNAAWCARMRPGAILVNTSRGFVVDAAALAAHLKQNPGAVAIIDVHDPEPFGAGYPLLHVPNAWLYPHLGAATDAAHGAMSWVVRDVWRVLSGEAPEWAAP